MRRKSLERLPRLEIPDGLVLRTFRAGDERGWANLMTGAIGTWNEDSTTRLFLGDPAVEQAGVFFLVNGAEDYVATATDKRLPESAVGYLHMVAVADAHRGKGLGRQISLAPLLHMRERGCNVAVLDTDDFRLPAIRTYLSLGFTPELLEPDHAERWRAVFADIGAAGGEAARVALRSAAEGPGRQTYDHTSGERDLGPNG